MNCYIMFIYDGILNTDRVQKMMILNGSAEEAGKYVKNNITEFYDYFHTMALNVKKTPDKNITELELAVKKAYLKYNYRCTKRADRKLIISELKHTLDEIDDSDIMSNFNSCNRLIMSNPNDQTPYKIIETHKFCRSLGTASVTYHLPNTFGL